MYKRQLLAHLDLQAVVAAVDGVQGIAHHLFGVVDADGDVGDDGLLCACLLYTSLEACIRSELDLTAQRRIAVLDPVKLIVDKMCIRDSVNGSSWLFVISEWLDSNSRPPSPKAGALPTAQHPGIRRHC